MVLSVRTRAPTQQQIVDAREILTNPDQFFDVPSLFRTSWEILKAERGQTIDLDRICPPAHRSEPTGDIITRIRGYACTKGYALRPEHSLRAKIKG